MELFGHMHNFFRDLSLTETELRLMLIASVVTLAAKGAALFPFSYSTDDISLLFSISYVSSISQGRFGWAFMSMIMSYFGVSGPLTNTLYTAMFFCSFLWIGLIICRIWRISDDLTLGSLAILFITIHPYQAEHFTFKINSLYMAVSYFSVFIGLYFSELKPKAILWTTFCIVLSLSIYQLSLHLISITLCIALALETLRQYKNDNSVDWRRVLNDTRLWPRLLTICLGILVYLILNSTIQFIFNITPDVRAQVISFRDLPFRFAQLRDTMNRMFILSEPIMPVVYKIMLGFLGVVMIFSSARRIFAKGFYKKNMLSFFCVMTLLLAAALCTVGIILFMKDWYPAPRVVSSISVFWAGIATLATVTSGKRFRHIVVILSGIVLFGFAGINNHIFFDQLRLNMRDFQKANRIVAKMESNPEFSNVQRVAVIRDAWNYASPIVTFQGDLNRSAFSAHWSKVSILKEVSGYNFTEATPAEQKLAEDHCENSPKWPHGDSITVIGNLCIVCQ